MNKSRDRWTAKKIVPLALLACMGIPGQWYYVEMSRGTGTGFVEVPRASDSRLITELKNAAKECAASTVLTGSQNISFIKIAGLYMKGRHFFFPGKDYFSPAATRAPHLLVRQFNLHESGSNAEFLEDQRVNPLFVGDSNAATLSNTSLTSVLNRRTSGTAANSIALKPYSHVDPHLWLVESELGAAYYSRNKLRIAMFPLEADPFLPGQVISAAGRYLLFQALGARGNLRFILDITTLNREGEVRRIPPAAAIGSQRVPFRTLGYGSARLISPPLQPQMIAGKPYLALDLGRDGTQIVEKRSGLMRLFGSDVRRDYRNTVALAREISILSENQYRAMRPPAFLDSFPRDLAHPDLEYSGIYEDGWIGDRAFVRLRQPFASGPLVIRGSVPYELKRTVIRILVDGGIVKEQVLGPGSFEVRHAIAPAGDTAHNIEIAFDGRVRLPREDREVGALLQCIGFTGCDSASTVFNAPVFRGDGWYGAEMENGSQFHWAGNEAELQINTYERQELALDLEPGPSADLPLRLTLADATGKRIQEVMLHQRTVVRTTLSQHRADEPYILRLHTPPGRIAGRDTRVLNFRIFRAALAHAGAVVSSGDIVSGGDKIRLTDNWYPLEHYENETFRWVNTDAGLQVTDSKAAAGLAMELEPGPGVAGKPLLLHVMNEQGRQVQTVEVRKRGIVKLVLPQPARIPARYRFRVEGGGGKIASDPRIMNFRVFRMYSTAHEGVANVEITGSGSGVNIGEGWYPLESHRGSTFRWLSNNGTIHVAAHVPRISIEAEPGPGAGGRALLLRVLDANGRQIQAARIVDRQTLTVFLPPGRRSPVDLRFLIEGGGARIPTDSRILNLRVFRVEAVR